MNKSPAKFTVSFLVCVLVNSLLLLIMRHFSAKADTMVFVCTGVCTAWLIYVIFFCRRSVKK
ncbi:MAG: hypothetical protein IKO44_04655 [Ruminococcus sp.]|nr:hypothetical protein [Ruminococcus sp.]MBR4622811.1 hypothetical protein [Ruminococcus sp.]